MRLDFEGGKYMQLDQNLDYKVKWSYLYVHPDVMINLSNWIGGYKDYRIYNAILYVGAGVASGGLNSPDVRSFEYLGNVGLQNRFYVCDAVSIDLQLQYTLGKSTFRPVYAHHSEQFHGFTAMVGATYRFNKRSFDRSGATEAEAEAMQRSIENYKKQAAVAEKDRDALRKELDKKKRDEQAAAEQVARRIAEAREQALKEAANKRPQTAKEAIDQSVDAILFFERGYGILSDAHKQRLDEVAEKIKKSDKAVYKIEGFADPDTGSLECNIRLANKRARSVYNYLIEKGVSAERLEYRNCGVENLPFGSEAATHNRAVVVY